MLYLRFKADESSQAITGPYRQLNPDDNNERQQIHEHRHGAAPARSIEQNLARMLRWACGVIAGWIRRAAVSAEPQSPRPTRFVSPTSRPLPASASGTTAARSARSTCRKRWVRAPPSSTSTTMAGRTCSCVELDELAGPTGAASLPALYRNNGNGTFTDITRQAGLAVEMYGLGVTAADYDNDGELDIYVTALGPNRLFQNLGGGKFSDVTARAGVGDPGFSTSAAWFDYDLDGRLDLFVANYVEWTIATRPVLHARRHATKSYCTPESYKGQSPTLYRNKGDGTFENVTRKGGAARSDVESARRGAHRLQQRRPDGSVRRQRHQPNRLYQNKGDGTFTDVGMTAGVAFNEAGVARAGMGVDAADYDGSGRQSSSSATSPTR